MNTFVPVVLIGSGLWLLLLCFMMNTHGFFYTLAFKLIPFILALGLLYIAAYQNGLMVAPGTPGVETNISEPTAELTSGRPPRVPCVARLKLDSDPSCMLAIATRRVPSNTSTALLAPMSERTAPIRSHA